MKMTNLIKESFGSGKILGGVLLVLGASTAASHADIDISDVHGLNSGNLSSTFNAGHTYATDWAQVFNAGGVGNLGDISGLSMYLENTTPSDDNVTISIATYNPITESYGTATALGTVLVPHNTLRVDSITLSDTTYNMVGGTDYALEFYDGSTETDVPFTSAGLNNIPTVMSSVTPDASLVGFSPVSNPPPYAGYQMGFEVDFTPVPEPTTILAGALMLLPFGASTLRFVRRNRAA